MKVNKELEVRVDAYIDEVWEDLVRDIVQIVSHPSVVDAEDAAPGAPFGANVRAALDCGLGIAERLGYATGEDDGYLGWGDILGERSTQVATITHVDVVPAGSGWATDPFRVERRDGWLLGRGVADDKGPAVLSLYAGAFFLHEGITPRYTFRALLGCDEEVGMSDVHHYLERHDDPAFLFTPDASFPVCNAEKGCFGGRFASAPVAGGAIRSWSGAEVSNAIPGESVVELAVDASELPAPAAHADRLRIEAVCPGVARVVARGIGGHASMPEGTINAVALIVDYLAEIHDLLAPAEQAYVELLDVLTEDAYGEAAGVASANEAFGPLTLNAGKIVMREDGRIVLSVDIRYPDSTSDRELEARLSELASEYGVAFEVSSTKPPFSVSAEHPAVQTLLDVYREVTGEPAEPFSMGGGTYARNFACAVSFGPEGDASELPDWVGPMHGANEGASEAALRQALKIYILALVRLQELDL
ncbi:Sapep family Mn(2+)-dependent dipeptidase [uncultured Enorma sp.]|uniref:Sapep family Mn(2+)-dependent dipeptidase n=1 Tax=uncultured Enorma sp. TaxID=1714346 RepID=UPI0028061A1F|nr:Sapep family Mn(2+)-dependent dipeptidase [uncultured Enorma sp.]